MVSGLILNLLNPNPIQRLLVHLMEVIHRFFMITGNNVDFRFLGKKKDLLLTPNLT